jgi:hypothetical protein
MTTVDYGAGIPLDDAIAAARGALATLQRLGHTADAEPPLTQAESTNYDAIVNDSTRSAAWKLQTCASKYITAMSTLARQLTAAAKIASGQDSTDAANVFGIKGLPGDVASLAISRRDAGDRIAQLTDPIARQNLLATAVRSGDDVLARAIAQQAVETGDASTASAFQEAYPALSAAIERLWNSQAQAQTGVDLMANFRLSALKPAPLKSLQNYEIASAASGNANAGSWNV